MKMNKMQTNKMKMNKMKMNKIHLLVSLLSCATVSAAQTPPPAPWRIVVEPETVLGPIKPMNAVSGGPTAKFLSLIHI